MSHPMGDDNANSTHEHGRERRVRDAERPAQDRQARVAPRQGGAASGVPDKDSAPETTPAQGTGIGGRS